MEEITLKRIKEFKTPEKRIGATYVQGKGVYIRLWAPDIENVEIEWLGIGKTPLQKADGYFGGFFPERKNGDKYYFYCDGKRIPDPASRFQPDGVFGPSEVLEQDYSWEDIAWTGVSLEETVIYEIHTGTFSKQHDFQGIIDDLPRLKDLGVTMLEIMPLSQFSGRRNWGYDGVFPHSIQNSYGGPREFKRLVDAAHAHGLGVMLDVVYNHLGPEGNVLFSLAPYTQSSYKTPWGNALNYDGEYSYDVRQYFLQTIWQWLDEYHLDGLRFDAVQTIFDNSPITFLQEINLVREAFEKEKGRQVIFIAETDTNDSKTLDPVGKNGMGFSGQWADDFHHALHATLTGEKDGYYSDYGGARQITKILKNGVAYEGEYSSFHKRPHGKSYRHIDKNRLVGESQNHDQIGNRLLGERLISLAGFEKAKLAASCVLLSPFMPLLFMGEELASENPFLYFVSHENKELNEAVVEGRREEWASFGWKQEPPDPSAEETFTSCVLANKSEHTVNSECMTRLYKKLIRLSKEIRKLELTVSQYNEDIIQLSYGQAIIVLLSFSETHATYSGLPEKWNCVLDTSRYVPENNEITYPAHEKNIAIAPYSAMVLRNA